MKKPYSLFLSVLFSFSLLTQTIAQPIFEVNGTAPLSLNSPNLIRGGGAGVGFYGPPINILQAKRKKSPSPLCLRFGGYFYFNGTGQKKFNDIPLLSPSQGNATVNFSNSLLGFNFSAKVSSSILNGAIIPYAEGFTGLRYFSSDMSIDPDNVDDKANYITITKVSGLNYGASGGVLFKINKVCYFDTGVMWTRSNVGGEYVDLHSLTQIGTNIGYKSATLPSDFLVFKMGITCYISDASVNGNRNCDGSFWEGFIDGLFNGSGGGGSGNIGLIKF